jgi:hypothetical protein
MSNDSPPDWSFASDQTFLDGIRRHVVSLTGTLHDLDSSGRVRGEERHFCCSGFIVEIRGVWCLVTAGHILLQEIEGGIKRGLIRLLKCGLMDYFSAEAIVKEPIPFPYQDIHRIAVDNEDSGLDFGIIPLPNLFLRSIAANGVRPLPVAQWAGRMPPQCGAYALLGLPYEEMIPLTRQGERGPQIGHMVNLVLVGVEPLIVPPINGSAPRIPRFSGILQDAGALQSAKGMSGGPILGINRNAAGGWSYECVAIQGSWREADRIILGTPMSIIIDAIERELDKSATG